MKLIIDIPEWKYKSICEGVEASKRCNVVGIDPDIHEAIYKGIPLQAEALDFAIKALEERPQGEWKYSDDTYETLVCSVCGFDTADYTRHNFCPNCGAEMKGGADNG